MLNRGSKIYGTGTIGEKGQIVVPAKARNELKIKPGDEFIFFGHGRIVHIIKAGELNTFLDRLTKRLALKISKLKKIKYKL